MERTTNTYWLARNKDGLLFLHLNRPTRNAETGAWDSKGATYLYDTHKFDYLKWEDSPITLDYKLNLQ